MKFDTLILHVSVAVETTLSLGWEYWPQKCLNLPKGILFGQLHITPICATHSAGAFMSGTEISLQIQVRAGVQAPMKWRTEGARVVSDGRVFAKVG